MRALTLQNATTELIGQKLFCPRVRTFWPVVTVTAVEPWPTGCVFITYIASDPDEFLVELAWHPNTRILVDSSHSPWQILDPGEEPPN